MGGGPWRDHEVDGARSRDLVRDVDIAALGIPRVGLHGRCQCPPRPSRVAMSPDPAKVSPRGRARRYLLERSEERGEPRSVAREAWVRLAKGREGGFS